MFQGRLFSMVKLVEIFSVQNAGLKAFTASLFLLILPKKGICYKHTTCIYATCYTRVGNMFIKSFTFHLFEYLITIIGKKFFNGIFFFFFCFFFFLLKTFEYGVPVNCSICNVNANFEFILLTICKLSWYIKVIIMADWVIKGAIIQNHDLVLFN